LQQSLFDCTAFNVCFAISRTKSIDFSGNKSSNSQHRATQFPESVRVHSLSQWKVSQQSQSGGIRRAYVQHWRAAARSSQSIQQALLKERDRVAQKDLRDDAIGKVIRAHQKAQLSLKGCECNVSL
jgi:hypothetical protein